MRSDMSEPIISVDGLVKTYESGEVVVQALRGVDLRVERGEMVAIMGPSGCGKTTLLNCVSGIDDATAGQVVIEGSDLDDLDDNSKTSYRARRMGFIFQFYNLLPVLSAVERTSSCRCSSPAHHRLRPGSEQPRRLSAWASRTGPHTSRRSSQVDQRQRVTIARALVNNPAIVWADEPTGDLDTATADSIMALMQELNREQHQTFVIVTHDPSIAARCHRTIHMVDGLIEREEVMATGG